MVELFLRNDFAIQQPLEMPAGRFQILLQGGSWIDVRNAAARLASSPDHSLWMAAVGARFARARSLDIPGHLPKDERQCQPKAMANDGNRGKKAA